MIDDGDLLPHKIPTFPHGEIQPRLFWRRNWRGPTMECKHRSNDNIRYGRLRRKGLDWHFGDECELQRRKSGVVFEV